MSLPPCSKFQIRDARAVLADGVPALALGSEKMRNTSRR